MKKSLIIFTGGGSAGHVTPNLAIMAALKEQGYKNFLYIGSRNGIEKEIISREDIPYLGIYTGKMRRYFSWENFIDPFLVVIGFFEVLWHLFQLKPNVVFSKGGFVAFPVVVAAKILGIPVIAHESDLTPGLANRLSYPFIRKLCVTFEQTKQYLKNASKVVVTGSPIRKELADGDAQKGRELCEFVHDKPVVLIIAGGLGSMAINQFIDKSLAELLVHYNVIHIRGRERNQNLIKVHQDYAPFGYVYEELPDLFACADMVVSRAGANALYELLVLKKPHLLIPLPKTASRGDQIVNAQYFEEQGISKVIKQEIVELDNFLQALSQLHEERNTYIENMNKYPLPDSAKEITDIIKQYL